MDFYSLIICIPVNTNCFTQKCDCFQNYSDIFLFLKHIMKLIKTSGKMLIVDRVMTMFLLCKIFWVFLALLPKAYHKKNCKVIEDQIYSKLFEIYKGTEKVVLVKFVEAIPFSGSHFFQWRPFLLVEAIFLAELIFFSGGRFI